jgi:hypothetical protein
MKYKYSVELEIDDLIPMAVVVVGGLVVAGIFVVAALVVAL